MASPFVFQSNLNKCIHVKTLYLTIYTFVGFFKTKNEYANSAKGYRIASQKKSNRAEMELDDVGCVGPWEKYFGSGNRVVPFNYRYGISCGREPSTVRFAGTFRQCGHELRDACLFTNSNAYIHPFSAHQYCIASTRTRNSIPDESNPGGQHKFHRDLAINNGHR